MPSQEFTKQKEALSQLRRVEGLLRGALVLMAPSANRSLQGAVADHLAEVRSQIRAMGGSEGNQQTGPDEVGHGCSLKVAGPGSGDGAPWYYDPARWMVCWN